MDIGVFTACNDESIAPAALARAVEERGFDSLFLPEHTHIPASETAYPDGTPLARGYYRNVDPLVALAAAAAVTVRLRLGTAVTLLAQHDPIVFAKQVATLDLVSRGRVEIGVGVGWNRQEMRNHGTDPRTRTRLVSERVDAITWIWTRELAEFHGELVDFAPIYSWPKPVQEPRPPVWVAGWGPTTFARVLDHGDGWMAPTGAGAGELAPGVDELRRLAAERGVPPPPVVATLVDADVASIRALRELGVRRTLLALLDSAPEAETIARLDELAALRDQAVSRAA